MWAVRAHGAARASPRVGLQVGEQGDGTVPCHPWGGGAGVPVPHLRFAPVSVFGFLELRCWKQAVCVWPKAHLR